MHFNIAEVVPAAGAAAELLGPILALSALVFVLGCVTMIDGLVRALFGAVASLFSHIPGVGSLTEAAIHKAEQAVSNALGTAIAGIEGRIAMQWHNLARAAEKLWNYQVGVAQNLWHLVEATNRLVTTGDVTHLLHTVERAIHGAERTITRDVTKTVHTTVKQIERLGHDVIPRIRALEHTIAVTIPKEIKSARDLAREAENGVARLWNRVRAIENSLSTTAIAAAVAAVLAAIGLDWIACRNGASRVGRTGCGIWDDLGKLFGWFVDLYIFTNLCSVMDELEPVVQEIAQPLISELYVGIEQWPCIVNHEPPGLVVPALQLPILSTYPVVVP